MCFMHFSAVVAEGAYIPINLDLKSESVRKKRCGNKNLGRIMHKKAHSSI